MMCLGIGFLGAFILLSFLRASWICGVVSDINFGKIFSHHCFKYFFCSFFSFPSRIPIVYVIPFVLIPQFLDILFCVFQSLFLCFSVLVVSIEISSSSEIFYLAV